MNEDIKELLDKLKDKDWYEEFDLTGTKWIELKQEETNLLLNYITNLQEKCENLDRVYKNLQEEHELVRCDLHNAWSWEKGARKEAQDYKSRIDKAIEYIKRDQRECLYENRMRHSDLLNILQGDDKE